MQLQQRLRHLAALGTHQGGQQLLVDAFDGVQNALRGRCALEHVSAFVAEPQPEIGRGQVAQWLAFRAQRVQVQALVLPGQQLGAPLLAHGREVLRHGEQAVRLLGARIAVARDCVALRHRLHGVVDHGGHHLAGQGLLRGMVLRQQVVPAVLEPARAAQHQVHGHVHARMDFTNLDLVLHQGLQVILRLRAQHLGDPLPHGPHQAGMHLLVRQQAHCGLVFQHGAVKVLSQRLVVGLCHLRHQTPDLRGKTRQQATPLVGIERRHGTGRQNQNLAVCPELPKPAPGAHKPRTRIRVLSPACGHKKPAAGEPCGWCDQAVAGQNGMSSSMSSKPEAARWGGGAMGAGAAAGGAMRCWGAAWRGAGAGARRGAWAS